jgi:polyisoprenyl-phosphate glycosyltransferase
MPRPTLSIILPVYNEEETLPELDRRLLAFLEEIGESWEVVFVNDGSKDRSYELLVEMCAREPRYRLISFSRNFGHQAAITAGLDRSRGEAVVVMDADLQDPPEVVRDMIAKWREGFEVVYGVRRARERETWFKRLTAAGFYRVLRLLIGINVPLDAGDFRLMARPVVEALQALRETHRFVRGMVSWVGFRQTAVYYKRPGRFAGETKFPVRKMLRFAADGITSFSTAPLKLAVWLGVASGGIAILTTLFALWSYFYGQHVTGWTTLMIAVSMGACAQLLMTGILGEYVGRIYEEVKRRPLYVVAKELNVPTDDKL